MYNSLNNQTKKIHRTISQKSNARADLNFFKTDMMFSRMLGGALFGGALKPASGALLRPTASSMVVQSRFLNLHEYQSQELMASYGVHVPPGKVASTPAEAADVARALGTEDLIVKAQVLAGGRGKGHFENGYVEEAKKRQIFEIFFD